MRTPDIELIRIHPLPFTFTHSVPSNADKREMVHPTEYEACLRDQIKQWRRRIQLTKHTPHRKEKHFNVTEPSAAVQFGLLGGYEILKNPFRKVKVHAE